MIKIKTNLFESVVGTIFLPNIGLVCTTIMLIISLLFKQKPIVYQCIIVSYFTCLFLMFFSLLLCFFINKKSKKELVFNDGLFQYMNSIYSVAQISFREYYACKWYLIPIAFIYKQQAAGLLSMKFNDGEQIQVKIFYRDYLALRKVVKQIVEK